MTTSRDGAGAARFGFDVALLADIDGDPEARDAEWRRVYAHYDPRLRDYFRARVRDEDALDDLLAHLWRRALRGLPELRQPAGAWNWLLRVGTNLLRDDWRRARVRDARHAAWERDVADDTMVPVDSVERGMDGDGAAADDAADLAPFDLASVTAVLDTFSTLDAAVLRLRLLEGLEHDAVARTLGLPSAAAARKRFSRARAVLQARLRSSQGRPRPPHNGAPLPEHPPLELESDE